MQLVEGGPNRTVRVQRYRRAADQTLADGTRALPPVTAATRPFAAEEVAWNVEDVVEASSKVPGEAVQAAIAESRNHEFVMSKKNLLALSNAGVAEPVIDLMIGIAFPSKFVVESRGGTSSGTAGISMGGGYYDPFMSPIMFGNGDAATTAGAIAATTPKDATLTLRIRATAITATVATAGTIRAAEAAGSSLIRRRWAPLALPPQKVAS